MISVIIGNVSSARAENPVFDWKWNSLGQPCSGDCFAAVYGGPFVKTSMTDIITLTTPAWKVKHGDGAIIAATLGRRAATLASFIDIEPEVGIAKRFGNQDEFEVWAAVYFRWTEFPWNQTIYTTAAVSTGLNYTFGISDIEKIRAGNDGEGSRLMHFFSPEITFAMPDKKDIELLFRFHHRSGGQEIFCDSKIFNCASGGAHYATVGLRFRY